MSYREAQRATTQDTVLGVSWPSAALYGAAAALFFWGLSETVITGLHEPAMAFAFGALVVAGELFRITYPAGRIQTPLASAGGLAYALSCSITGESASHQVGQTVAVVTVGMAVGALPHGITGRPIRLDSIARRVLGVALTAAFYCYLLAADGLGTSWRDDPRLEALVMLAVLLLVLAVEWALRAAVAWAGSSGTVGRHLVTEAKVAPGIEVSVVVTAVTLAIAAAITGPWAIPLFSVPLLLTQASYRHFNAARATYAQTINALSKATELAGFTVVGHARRVADLAVELGKALGMGPHELTELEYAALLHDLGQMTLTQPLPGGATTGLPAETRMQIAASGASLIEEAQIPASVAHIVGRQADPWAKTRGSSAPLAARIIAVANAYDDLTRGQAAAAQSQQAVHQIRQGAGGEFDPQVVEALTRKVCGASDGSHSSQTGHVARG